MKPAVSFLLVGAMLTAQDPVIKVDVDLVSVLATVRTRQNAIVADLTKDDFKIYEDGKEREIKYFARETDLPLTIGLLVDVSKSQERLIETERHAARQFFSAVLKKKDMAFLISFGAEAELLQDSTNSQKLLSRALDELRLNAGAGGIHPGPVPTISRQAGTVFYDAVYLASAEKLQREAGRKAIVVITDGMDYGSRYSKERAIEAAQKADAIIYGIYYSDPGMYPGSDSVLKRMSDETGGRTFRVDRKNSLEEIFKQIQEEMRSQYAMAFTPANPTKDGSFHKLEVKTNKKDLKIQARKGYYAMAPE